MRRLLRPSFGPGRLPGPGVDRSGAGAAPVRDRPHPERDDGTGRPQVRRARAAQKEAFLRPLAKGNLLGAFCLTEPHTGSDAAAIKTRARRQGNRWIVNGTKQFITSGQNADVAIVLIRCPVGALSSSVPGLLIPTV